MTAMPSSKRSKRSLSGGSPIPKASCSATFHPAPTPSTSRPPERRSTAAAIRASRAGCRNVIGLPVLACTTAPKGVEGEGFPVRRAVYGLDQRYLDPFIHMDQMGEVEYGPGEPKGTAWHPHRGFETVTYMIDGTFQHQDSTGGGGLITNGATQWMTAGAGILHIERPPEALIASGGLFHGIQLWVNLPAERKWTPPRYQGIAAARVTLLASHDGGALLRVIAGEVAGHGWHGVTHHPITLGHVTINSGSELRLPWRREFNGLVYVLAGRGTVGAKRAPIRTGQLAALGAGDLIGITADLAH